MKLLNLANKSRSLEIRSKSATKAEIVIYGSIGQPNWLEPDAVSAKVFSDELKKLDATVNEIDLRLNSPGGDVFEGVAIYNRIKQHKAKFTVYIDGLAASIASIIALAGDEIVMGEGALFMVHLPWTWAMGDRNSLENTIQRLMDVEEQMVGIYAKKTGLGRSEIKKMLEDETWMDADQAIENGFANSKFAETMPIAASLLNKSWINKVPKSIKTEDTFVKNKIDEFLKTKLTGKK